MQLISGTPTQQKLCLCTCGGREEVKMARIILPITLIVLFLAVSVESVIDCHKLDFTDPTLPIPGLCYGDYVRL